MLPCLVGRCDNRCPETRVRPPPELPELAALIPEPAQNRRPHRVLVVPSFSANQRARRARNAVRSDAAERWRSRETSQGIAALAATRPGGAGVDVPRAPFAAEMAEPGALCGIEAENRRVAGVRTALPPPEAPNCRAIPAWPRRARRALPASSRASVPALCLPRVHGAALGNRRRRSAPSPGARVQGLHDAPAMAVARRAGGRLAQVRAASGRLWLVPAEDSERRAQHTQAIAE